MSNVFVEEFAKELSEQASLKSFIPRDAGFWDVASISGPKDMLYCAITLTARKDAETFLASWVNGTHRAGDAICNLPGSVLAASVVTCPHGRYQPLT
ncbi:hypothetical protein Pan44_25160 [Caulifigura coniformis]|uniref:Uncharacterized protein n=1 Tax=Caulifigura coniformis TaxID=2527983 RepID=A0A517SEC4_9PLAN|nr:hypothetical protein [Caulifigura coniformis]QDT54483.1 hypothetical protein Pan44_25160 [Caulifigura coniformis]